MIVSISLNTFNVEEIKMCKPTLLFGHGVGGVIYTKEYLLNGTAK
jgi:hypothetical protein